MKKDLDKFHFDTGRKVTFKPQIIYQVIVINDYGFLRRRHYLRP